MLSNRVFPQLAGQSQTYTFSISRSSQIDKRARSLLASRYTIRSRIFALAKSIAATTITISATTVPAL